MTLPAATAELEARAGALAAEIAAEWEAMEAPAAAAIGDASDRITADVARWAAKCDPAHLAAPREGQ